MPRCSGRARSPGVGGSARYPSGDVEDGEPFWAAGCLGSDLFVLLLADERSADRRLLGNAPAPWIGFGRRDEHVGSLFAIFVANLDSHPQANDAVASRHVFDWLGDRQERAKLTDAAFEERQRVHGVAQVEILGGIVAAGSGIAEPRRYRRQLRF